MGITYSIVMFTNDAQFLPTKQLLLQLAGILREFNIISDAELAAVNDRIQNEITWSGDGTIDFTSGPKLLFKERG